MVANYTGLQKPLAGNLASSYTTIQSQSTNITQHQPYSTVKSTSSVPYVCLTDVVSVNLLTETEAWAVLSQLAQRLQDNLLRNNSRSSDKENQSLFITGENVLLHSSGLISVATASLNTVAVLRSSASANENIYATRSRAGDEKDVEKRGLAEIGALLQKCIEPIISLEFRTLLNQMSRCCVDLGQVLLSIQQFWSGFKGKTSGEVVSMIYQNTVTAYTKSSINSSSDCLPGSSKWKQSQLKPHSSNHLLLPNKPLCVNYSVSSVGPRSRQPLAVDKPGGNRTRRRETVTIGSSVHSLYNPVGSTLMHNSTSTVHNSTSTLPISSLHTSTSTLPSTSTTVLNQARRSTSTIQLDGESERSRRYGKRLEFRPPLTEKLSRKFGPNLDPNKSVSTSAIDKALQEDTEPITRSANNYEAMIMPYTSKYATLSTRHSTIPKQSRRQQQRLEPEFIIKSTNPPIESCLAKSEASGVNVTVKVMTGQKLNLKIDDNTRVQDVLSLTVRFLGFQKVDESFFCLTKLIDNEYFYVSPSWKLTKLREMQIFDIENENPRKSKSRRRSSSLHARYTALNTDLIDSKNKDMGTFNLRFFETPDNLSSCSKRLIHLMYLQIRQDYLHGYYRMGIDDHIALSGLTLKLDSMGGHPENIHRYLVERFSLEHYLPTVVTQFLGEKQGKDLLIKMAQKVDPTDNSSLEIAFINRLKNSGGLVNFVYTQDNKGLDLRLENCHLVLVEACSDKFSSGQPATRITWQDVKELKKQGDQIYFHDSNSSNKYKLEFGSRCRRILDALQQNVRAHANKNESPRIDRGKRFREFCQKLRSHVTEGTTGGAGRREIKKKRRSLPSLGSDFRSSLIETRTRCSIRRLKHYSSMANNIIVKSATDLSSKSSLTSKTSKSSSKTSLTSSKASPSDDERKNMKKFKLDIKGMGAAPQSIVDKPEYRYRVYLENDDYDDMSSSMESSAIVDYTVLDKKTGPSTRRSTQSKDSAMNRTGSVENVVKEVRNKNPTNLFASNEKMFRSCDDITGLFSTNQRANGYQHNSKASSRSRGGRGARSRRSHKILRVMEQENGSPVAGEGLDSSLSVSLLERFDNMDTAEWEPTRKVVAVQLRRNESTRKLGVRITETPSGIYVEGLEDTSEICSKDGLKVGDKILEIDGINIEGLGYARVLEIIQRSGNLVQLIVSQLVNT